jgi:hypothetical protein
MTSPPTPSPIRSKERGKTILVGKGLQTLPVRLSNRTANVERDLKVVPLEFVSLLPPQECGGYTTILFFVVATLLSQLCLIPSPSPRGRREAGFGCD